MRSTDMYAGKLNDGTLFHFYPGKILITSVCGCPEAFKVRVTEADQPRLPGLLLGMVGLQNWAVHFGVSDPAPCGYMLSGRARIRRKTGSGNCSAGYHRVSRRVSEELLMESEIFSFCETLL